MGVNCIYLRKFNIRVSQVNDLEADCLADSMSPRAKFFIFFLPLIPCDCTHKARKRHCLRDVQPKKYRGGRYIFKFLGTAGRSLNCSECEATLALFFSYSFQVNAKAVAK